MPQERLGRSRQAKEPQHTLLLRYRLDLVEQPGGQPLSTEIRSNGQRTNKGCVSGGFESHHASNPSVVIGDREMLKVFGRQIIEWKPANR